MTNETSLHKLLKSRKTEDRIRALGQLTNLPDAERIPLLLETLDDSSKFVAAMAAERLRDVSEWRVAPKLVEKFLFLSESGLSRDPGCHIRGHLAFALGKMEFHGAIEALRIGIRTHQIEPVGGVPFDTGAHLRANCALALAQLRASDALRDITLLLFDLSGHAFAGDTQAHIKVEPRKAAAQAMVILGDRNALIPLTLRLVYPQNEHADVLQECMTAVVELEDDRLIETLSPYLSHSDQFLAAHAALCLARSQNPEALPLLLDTLSYLSGNPLRAVVFALQVIRSDAAHTALIGLLAHPREAVRLAAIEALADTRDEIVYSQLQILVRSDPAIAVRKAAKNLLGC